MENFRRLFAIKDGGASGWTDSRRTSFIISVENNELTVKVKSGRDPFVEEVNTAFGRFLQAYEAEFGEKVALYERTHRYRFCYRQGMSGCQDTFIEFDRGDGFPERKFLMHESCFGKCADLRCFVYDFLDICVVGGFLSIEDGCYTYSEGEDANADCNMQIISPRLVEAEEGWSSPWEKPEEVVYLNVVRETNEQ